MSQAISRSRGLLPSRHENAITGTQRPPLRLRPMGEAFASDGIFTSLPRAIHDPFMVSGGGCAFKRMHRLECAADRMPGVALGARMQRSSSSARCSTVDGTAMPIERAGRG